MEDRDFDELFTRERPVIFAYHGYPTMIHKLMYRRSSATRKPLKSPNERHSRLVCGLEKLKAKSGIDDDQKSQSVDGCRVIRGRSRQFVIVAVALLAVREEVHPDAKHEQREQEPRCR
jgi:hypothetical protein